MKPLISLFLYIVIAMSTNLFAQVQWASKLIDFSSEYKSELIQANSTRCSAAQVLGLPNVMKYGESSLAWSPAKQQAGKEFVTVGFATPQTVQQIVIGETYNAGSICEIILYDNNGKKYTVYENKNPSFVKKYNDLLSYFKIKPVYNVNKLKLVLNTDAVGGGQEIDCIGILSSTAPYQHQVNVIKYSETVGIPENLGPNINSSYYDHLPLISPDGSMLYFIRKLTNEDNTQRFDDDIYLSHIMPTGKFTNAENIGPPLNNQTSNFVCFISKDNNRLYVANKYIKNTYNYSGLSVSSKQKNGDWSKPKPLSIPDLYNKNEFAHYHMNLDENIALMCIQRDDSYGDLDIYVSQKYSDGDWSKPKNIGPVINTVGAEGSVFLAADNKTLYFSSTGHAGFGSYDMFMTKRLDDTWTNWSKPINLGNKINTDEMDIYYTIPAAGDYAYFSSGQSYFGKNDLYRIKLPKEARPEFVDVAKVLASSPIQKNTIPTYASNTNIATTPTKTTQPTTPPKSTVTPISSVNKTTDELQNKLEELKKQQAQATRPTTTVVAQQPKQEITPVSNVPSPTTSIKASVSTTMPTSTVQVKKEVVNYIEPYKTPEELRQKPATTNTIKPAEMPKTSPHVLTKEELAAREQQKSNPTINPANDNLTNLTKRPQPEIIPTSNVLSTSSPQIQNPTIVTTEVEPVATPATTISSVPSSVNLRTSQVATDDLQQKLDALKQQQSAIQQPSTTTYTTPTSTISVREQYPNPSPVLPTSNAKTDDLQRKLDELKQQQNQVGQSNKIYANPYEQKPYGAQAPKERQEDMQSVAYDDYKKKLDDLKKQQQSVSVPVNTTTSVNTPPAKLNDNNITPSLSKNIIETTPTIANNTSEPNPILSKYEEKLRKMKEEMAALNATPPTDTKLDAVASTPISNITTNASAEPESVADDKKAIVIDKFENQDEKQNTHTNTSPKETIVVSVPAIDFELEKAKLDSFQQAQKAEEQKMLASIDKMGANKQTLENDIADLKAQQKKFNEENDKLTAQNSQLASEREKQAIEKKKMEDLLAQMQEERDKLAAEKLKMEQDKAKLELLKKQQEKDVFTLKRSIDSLSKIQQKTANTSTTPQNYDLFNVPLQVGAVAQVNNIYFVADASFLQIPSYPELDKVALFLARNQKLKVEIGGHTNGLCDDFFCQKLSTSRAKTCVDYLISKGIASNRLTYKGYGKSYLLKPAEPGNSLNQRVEIKILSMD